MWNEKKKRKKKIIYKINKCRQKLEKKFFGFVDYGYMKLVK